MGSQMTNCMDTIFWPRPLEATTTWLFRGALRGARLGDRVGTAVIIMLLEWRRRAAERRLLRSLSDRMLKDIGVSRADIEREWCKSFWRE